MIISRALMVLNINGSIVALGLLTPVVIPFNGHREVVQLDAMFSNVSLRLSKNNLSGTIPPDFGNFSPLRRFEVAYNNLTGAFPEQLCHGGTLSWLAAMDNNLNGSCRSHLEIAVLCPIFRGAVPNLTRIEMSNNKFFGKIPSTVSSWRNMAVFEAGNNLLSGTVPTELTELPKLTRLLLGQNELSGILPTDIGPIPAKLENAAYDTSFLNNPGLCASNSFMRINLCNAQSHRLSKTNLTLIVILAIAAAMCVLLVVLFTIRASRKNRIGLKEHNVIGSGGSGKVYRIIVNPSGDAVAVKRIWNNKKLNEKLEKQLQQKWRYLGTSSIGTLSNCYAVFLARTRKLLVYEYMENSSLDHWLHKKKGSSPIPGVANNMILDWPKRLQIALGAAKGLCYMHNDCSSPIIHRDVKSSNILLDSEFNAKLLTSALQGSMPVRLLHTLHMLEKSFQEDFGRVCLMTRVNEKIDVYSFGVVLLETNHWEEANDRDEDMCLADWAWRHIQDGNPISDALDEEIKDDSNVDEISNVFKLGIFCCYSAFHEAYNEGGTASAASNVAIRCTMSRRNPNTSSMSSHSSKIPSMRKCQAAIFMFLSATLTER
ncbi:receptor-like protein kinase 5 [Eucalyptus grandis]|uniref:receptor-like protein kinase 5 n=1 Tax=Eucalyptus grandis TaxID=71139 RepID=UPI00192EE63C|nr:receptor-like protein kinase 5 [Eucalyptus grandis]